MLQRSIRAVRRLSDVISSRTHHVTPRITSVEPIADLLPDAEPVAARATTAAITRPWEFVKGHGTQNDFILLPDADDELVLTAEMVRSLCERRTGIGADGVIRVVRSGATQFFMDYYNADGSVAEMCGNGARVFARFLVDQGWITPGRIEFTTRGGAHWADLGTVGDVAIGMGRVSWGERVSAALGDRMVEGVAVDVGNPHIAVVTDDDVDGFDLSRAPSVDPSSFPAGVNIEVVQIVGDGHVRMRVFERGVGETRSCGTGTVAAAIAYLLSERRSTGRVTVTTPGGDVRVAIANHPHGPQATLIGPAVLVVRGTVDLVAERR